MPDLRIPPTNQFTVAGRLTRDPETRKTNSGHAITSFGFAHSRKRGEREEKFFADVQQWGDKSADRIMNNLAKGDPVMVTGRLKVDEWDDKMSGAKRQKLVIDANEVEPLSWKDRGTQPAPQQQQSQAPSWKQEQAPRDEDLPF